MTTINKEFEDYVAKELGDIAVVSEGRYISPKIQNYYKVWQHQEARIAALTKDAERLKCFNQIWRWKALKDGEIIYQYGEHVPALFQKTAELLPTHPPAPKAITADDVTKQMVEMFENASPDELGWWGDSDRDDIIAAAVNAFNGVKP